jgi:hypothetical protein
MVRGYHCGTKFFRCLRPLDFRGGCRTFTLSKASRLRRVKAFIIRPSLQETIMTVLLITLAYELRIKVQAADSSRHMIHSLGPCTLALKLRFSRNFPIRKPTIPLGEFPTVLSSVARRVCYVTTIIMTVLPLTFLACGSPIRCLASYMGALTPLRLRPLAIFFFK